MGAYKSQRLCNIIVEWNTKNGLQLNLGAWDITVVIRGKGKLFSSLLKLNIQVWQVMYAWKGQTMDCRSASEAASSDIEYWKNVQKKEYVCFSDSVHK